MLFEQEFTQMEQEALHKATTYGEVAEIALGQMNRISLAIGKGLDMVCGPISSGGLGSIEKNIERFNEAIDTLLTNGYSVFSQMPYEDKIWSIRDMAEEDIKNGAYDQNLLEDFYGPVFRSGLVKRKHFIPDWQSSIGACWEHNLATETGTDISYLGHHLLPLR